MFDLRKEVRVPVGVRMVNEETMHHGLLVQPFFLFTTLTNVPVNVPCKGCRGPERSLGGQLSLGPFSWKPNSFSVLMPDTVCTNWATA